ncbi:MAG: ABC transporter ATP-binding protein [Chlamydiia bacterium]|nr:ABC transporter ATP-binding protein [Chlamydiia bacterium]
MIVLSVANTLEIFAIGFITNKGDTFKGGFIDKAMLFVSDIIPIDKSVYALGCFIVFVSFFKAVSLFAQRYLSKLSAIRIAQEMRLRFFKHIQALPMSFYQENTTGALSSRVVGDAALIAEAVNGLITNYVQTPFTVATALAVCILTSWKLSLLIFVGMPLILFPIIFLAKRTKRVARQIQQNQEKFSSVLIDFIGGIQTVKVFAMEAFSLKKYEEYNDKMATLEKKSAKYDLLTRPVVHTIAMLLLVFSLLWGLFILDMELPDVLLFAGMLYLFYEPIKKFAEENSRIQRGLSALERLQEVIDLPPEEKLEEGKTFQGFSRNIVFKQVAFKYQNDWVLKGLDLEIKKGEMVALVGATGSGKSTLVQLLPRLWDPQEGEILIDGENSRFYTPSSLREKIAFVPQKPFLFLDTVAENIKFGRDFSEKQVIEAAEKAHAHEFIKELPKAYETYLSEGGKNLSGGQQQRLTIARALLKKAPILIMDEATSSLDALSEHYIKETIQSMKGEVTQIIIAHRLSTIENADKIFYLSGGQVIASGTKDELLKTCPSFKQLWELLHKPS